MSYLELGRFVRVSHEVVRLGERRTRGSPKPLWWPVPDWNSFLAYDVFGQKWKRWERHIKQAVQGNPTARGDSLPRLLAVAWVACVLDTFWTLAPLNWVPRSWSGLDEVEVHQRIKTEREKITSTLGLKPETIAAEFRDETSAAGIVAAAEEKVIGLAEDLYRILVEEPPSSENKRTTFLMEEGTGFVKDWLDQKLPLLLSCLYVPLSGTGLTERHQAIEQVYRKRIPKLAKAWRDNSAFILADMETTMADMFGSTEGATEEKHKAKAAIPSLDSSGIPGHFADLHRLLN